MEFLATHFLRACFKGWIPNSFSALPSICPCLFNKHPLGSCPLQSCVLHSPRLPFGEQKWKPMTAALGVLWDQAHLGPKLFPSTILLLSTMACFLLHVQLRLFFILGDITLASSRRFSPDSFPGWLCPCELCAPLWPSSKECLPPWCSQHRMGSPHPHPFRVFKLLVTCLPGVCFYGLCFCLLEYSSMRQRLWPLFPCLSIVQNNGFRCDIFHIGTQCALYSHIPVTLSCHPTTTAHAQVHTYTCTHKILKISFIRWN